MCGLVCMSWHHELRSQLTSPLSQSSLPRPGTDKSSLPPTLESMVFQSGVDPKEYHLGPGYVLQCRFWTSGDAYYPVVSSDQMLLVPLLGPFDARGKTLYAIREEVMKKAEESFAK